MANQFPIYKKDGIFFYKITSEDNFVEICLGYSDAAVEVNFRRDSYIKNYLMKNEDCTKKEFKAKLTEAQKRINDTLKAVA